MAYATSALCLSISVKCSMTSLRLPVLSQNHKLPHPCEQRLRSLSDLLADPLSTLPRVEMLALLTIHHLRRLLHNLLALSQDELDVAGVGPGT